MKLIPALDLKHGCVVHATGGDRKAYRPLSNTRFPSSSPGDVIRRLHERLRCSTFYIADLDAIAGNGDNAPLIHELGGAFPEFDLWLDAGIRNHADFMRLRRCHATATPVVATETLSDRRLPETLHSAREEFILSLDFGADGLLGDESVLESSEYWPKTVIALSLSAVGTGGGPDLDNLLALQKKYPRQRFVTGGGVRDERDLTQLEEHGVTAVLVADALYTGAIDNRTGSACRPIQAD